MFKIAVTGLRPSKLGWGYDYNEEHYMRLKYFFENNIADIANHDVACGGDGCIEMITGMALGVDTVFALAAIELIQLGYNIHLIAAIPFKGQESRWPKQSRLNYKNILTWAYETIIVSPGDYSGYKMQKRNMYMVDRSDEIVAIWDGSNGGTCNCVRYAMSQNKKVNYIKPEYI